MGTVEKQDQLARDRYEKQRMEELAEPWLKKAKREPFQALIAVFTLLTVISTAYFGLVQYNLQVE